MRTKPKLRRLELVNSEGPILVAHMSDEGIVILTDEWKHPINAMSEPQFESFIAGEFGIFDSAGRVWNYAEHKHHGPSENQIKRFLEGR